MIKKVNCLTSSLFSIILLISIIFNSYFVFAADNIVVKIDGQRINFLDQPPVIVNNRTLVPIRGVFETLGYTVNWHEGEQTVTLSNGVNTVIIKRGENTFETNGESYNLDVPAQTINNRMMIPFRALLESINYKVDWDGSSDTIVISTVENSTEQQKSFDISMYEYEWFESEIPFQNNNYLKLQGNELYIYLTRLYYGTATLDPSLQTQDITFVGEYLPDEKVTATISFVENSIVLYIHNTENVPYGESVSGELLTFKFKKALQ